MRFGHALMFLFFVIFITGCSPKIICEEPNVLLGSTCCLDEDNDGVCDSPDISEGIEKETPENEEAGAETQEDDLPEREYVQTDEEVFAEQFEATWNKRNYNALYKMFDEALKRKLSSPEFNFLMKRMHENLGIQSISFKDMIGGTAEYIVTAEGDKGRITGLIVEEDGELKHSAFYYFKSTEVEDACDSDECFFDFAKISGNRALCEKTGELRDSCLDYFGSGRDFDSKMSDCAEMNDYFAKAECFTTLANKENTIEPCWEIEHDKQKYECMGEVAAIEKDADLCWDYVNSPTIPGNRRQHGHCIMGYVRKTNDTSACKLIERRDDVVLGAMSENCMNLDFV